MGSMCGRNDSQRPWIRLAFLAAVCTAIVSVPVRGACGQRFRAYRVRIEGEIKAVRPADLDGDGRREFLVSSTRYCNRVPERTLSFCGWRGQGKDANLVLVDAWKVPPEAVFWDVGPAGDGAGGDHCYFLSARGLFELSREAGSTLASGLRIEAPLFLAGGQEDEFARLAFMRDWDGDGRVEAMLPLDREARFYRRGGAAGWERVDSVGLSPFAYYNNNVLFGRNLGLHQYLAVIFYPLLEAADMNGDGRKDLLVLRNGKGFCYLRGENGKLDPEPLIWNLEVRTGEELARRRATLSYRVADLNRDGCADVVVHKVGMQFVSWSAETAVFLGRSDGAGPERPTFTFPSRGLLSGVSLEDLDGDGYPDMTLWSVRMGLWPMVEILLRRVIHIKARYSYGTWPEGFPAEAANEMDFVLHVDAKRPDYIRGLVPCTEGDFDRDGIRDLVASKGEGRLAVYRGLPARKFASRAWAVLAAPGVNYVGVEDLDGDGRSDLYGYEVEKGFSRLHVWLQGP